MIGKLPTTNKLYTPFEQVTLCIWKCTVCIFETREL